MSENSKIGWTDHTFNPWIGCTKVSPGCAHCYAESLMDHRWGRVRWGKGQPRVRTVESNWAKVRQWDRKAERDFDAYEHWQDAGREFPWLHDIPRRPRVFCASLADWLDEEVPIEWLQDLLALVMECPHLDFLMLTKRPQNWAKHIEAVLMRIEREPEWETNERHPLLPLRNWLADWFVLRRPPENVWIGTTVEDQARADERIPQLLDIPARVRFLSCEPLLGPVEIGHWNEPQTDAVPRSYRIDGIHWVIAGGESGNGCRPMEIEWARSLKDQCAAAGVPFYMKQLGGTFDHRSELTDFPEDLRLQQFPTTSR